MDDWVYKIKNSLENLHLQTIHEQLKESCKLYFPARNIRSIIVGNDKNNYNKLANKLSNS